MSVFSRLKQPQGQQWLVVDKVRVSDIEDLAYTYLPDLTLVHLFAGTPYEHLNEVGPVAIKYTAITQFETMLLNDFALRTSSVLFSAEQGIEQHILIEHLQALHYVIKDESPLFCGPGASGEVAIELNYSNVDRFIQCLLGVLNESGFVKIDALGTIGFDGRSDDFELLNAYLTISVVFGLTLGEALLIPMNFMDEVKKNGLQSDYVNY